MEGGIRQVVSVLLVFALLGAMVWKLRRGSGAGIFRVIIPSISSSFKRRVSGNLRSLQQLEKLALTPQHSLHLVRIQGREIVVATHPHGCTVIESGAGTPVLGEAARA